MVAIVLSLVVGLISAGILTIQQNKNKTSESSNVKISAENFKNKLIMALNSKPAFSTTRAGNQTKFDTFVNPQNTSPTGGSGGAGGTTANVVNIDVYDQESHKLTEVDFPRNGFDAQGASCSGFNETEGHDTCFFQYQVNIKYMNSATSPATPTLHAELKFKPRTQKVILNTTIEKYSFDWSPGVEAVMTSTACETINGVFDQSTQVCSRQVTLSSAGCPSGQSLRSIANADNCQAIAMPVTKCPTGQYTLGFDANNQPVCTSDPAPGSASPIYSCNSGWTLNGVNCGKDATATNSDYYIPDCGPGASSSDLCSGPSGFTASTCYCQNPTAASYPDCVYPGTTFTTYQCNTYTGVNYSCPSGGTLNGTTCEQAANRSCPAAYPNFNPSTQMCDP